MKKKKKKIPYIELCLVKDLQRLDIGPFKLELWI